MSEDYCEVIIIIIIIIIIITAASADWLVNFTRSLVDDGLAVCGQDISAIWSIYRWQGSIEDAAEARVALHTRASLVPAIIVRTNADFHKAN